MAQHFIELSARPGQVELIAGSWATGMRPDKVTIHDDAAGSSDARIDALQEVAADQETRDQAHRQRQADRPIERLAHQIAELVELLHVLADCSSW